MPTTIQEMMEEKMKLDQDSTTSSDNLIKSWIHDCAPKVNVHQHSKEREDETKALISQLQDFVGNGSDSLKPSTVSAPLASLCGALFEKGESMYYCKDCKVEDSRLERSILCETCFFGSEHRFHNYDYRPCMLIGRFCDCGDPQSWTNFPSCSIHDLDSDKPEPAPLPEDVVKRAKAVFQAILEYALNFHSMEQSPRLTVSEVSEVSEDDDQYCVVVLCDTYARVKLQDIPNKTEFRLASTKFPYNSVCWVLDPASFDNWNEIKAKIADLKPIVERPKVVSNQILALNLLDWLNNYTSQYQQLRTVVANLALETSVFHKIITSDYCLWRGSRQIWLNLIKSATLVSDKLKSSLAEHLIVNYGSLARELRMSHNTQHAYYHCESALSLTRNFLVEESLARRFISHRDLMFVLIDTFMALNSTSGKLSITKEPLFRSEFVIDDLKLVLSVFKPKEDDWTDQLLRASFVTGVSQFLELLNGIQLNSDMDEKVANDLNNLLFPISNLIVEWCTSDDEISNEIFQKVLQVFKSCNKLDNYSNKVVKIAEHEASCVKVQTEKQEKQPVSSLIRLPLSRLLVNLVLHSKSFFDLDMKKYLLETIELALTVQATAALTKASKPIDGGPIDYYGLYHRNETMEKDVFLLQVGAALFYDRDEFLIRALDKFDLVDWAREDYESCFIDQSVKLETIVGLVDEFLEMLIKMIEDRYVVGLTSEMSKDECLKHKTAANRVSAKPMSLKNFQLSSTGEIKYEKIIKDMLRRMVHVDPFDSKKMIKKLPRLTKKFEFLVDILQCDVMIHIIKIILTRKLDLESASFSESHLIKILHIIKLALEEQESNYYNEFFSFIKRAEKHQIFDLLEEIEKTLRKTDPNKKLLNSLMDKYKELAAKSSKTMNQESWF